MNDATVKFGYDGTSLKAGLRGDELRLKSFADNTESRFARLTGKVNSHLGKLGTGIGIVGIMSFTKSALEDFDAIAAGSLKLNTTAETYQRLGKAASILGNTDIETVTSAIIKLRRQLIDDPTGDMAQGLEEIGFKAQDFLKLDADQQVLALADAFQSAEAGGRQLPVLTKALGKNFSELIPLLTNGKDELKKFMDKSVVASNAAVAAADEINDRYDAMVGKIGTVAKALAVATAQGLGEMLGLMPRTQIDADGSKARAKDAAREAENQRKRNEEAAAAAAAADRAMKERVNQLNLELEKKRESIKLSEIDVTMLELQAKGQDRKLKKMQEQAFIEKRAHEFAAQGLDANASIALAQREWNARENIEKRKRTGRSHIGGVGTKRMMGGGLDEFARLQNTATFQTQNSLIPGPYADDPNRVNVPVFSGSLSERRQNRGRMMGGDSLGAKFGANSLTSRSATNTKNPDISSAVAKGNDVPSKIDKTNEILTKGLFG